MKKKDIKKGVFVITLTASLYFGDKCKTTYTERFGFCGKCNKKVLASKLEPIKASYKKSVEAEYAGKPVMPDRIVCRAKITHTECEYIIDNLLIE